MFYLVPFFVLVITLEYLYSRRKKIDLYRPEEMSSNLLNGAGQQSINLVWFALLIHLYNSTFERFALIHWKSQDLVFWLVVVVVTDFLWYWSHRASHRVNVMAASHFAHHCTQEFNHASALRQSWTSRLLLFPFFWPMALLGFDAKALLTGQVITATIQFLTHNGVSKRRVPGLDRILVTPRSHWVHHGINGPYLDRNFGGVFIFWDRAFGTYQDFDESIPMEIGTRDGLNYLDPFESNLNYFKRIVFVSRRESGWVAKTLTWFQPPEHLESRLAALGFKERSLMPVRGPAASRTYGLYFISLICVTLITAGVLKLWPAANIPEKTALLFLHFGAIFGAARITLSNKRTT